MTEFLETIKGKLSKDCLVKGGLKKDGCKVVMTDMPQPRLVVDLDKPGSPLEIDEKRCDYFLFAEDKHECRWVVVLELKHGKLRLNKAVRQLRAGASAAESLIPQDEEFRFRPVAATGSVRKDQRRQLKNNSNMIELHGKKEPIRLMACGERLVMVLNR